MRIKETKVYQFNELSDKAKERACEWGCDLNVDHNWWEFTYEDAKNIGIKINEFDLDRRSMCDIDFITSAKEVAQSILKEHGPTCETYKTAESFLQEFRKAKTLWESNEDNEGFYFEDEEAGSDMCDEFRKSIAEDYRIILQKEYDYLTSTEAIEESIIANEYEFDEDGRRA